MPFQTREQLPVALFDRAGSRDDHNIPADQSCLRQAKTFADDPLDSVSSNRPAGDTGRNHHAQARIVILIDSSQYAQTPS